MTPAYTIRPVSDRTNFTGKHQRSQFEASWSATEQLLIREVRHLRGKDLVIEVDVMESDIRLDGRIRAGARPPTPGVRVAFESMHGPLTYATDRFTTWQDNVRAIALGLEALRKVDRYGITKRGEQYAGWKALPAGRGEDDSHMTADEAWSVLASLASDRPVAEVRSTMSALAVFKKARAAAHPDRHGGDRTLWDAVETAGRVLRVL